MTLRRKILGKVRGYASYGNVMKDYHYSETLKYTRGIEVIKVSSRGKGQPPKTFWTVNGKKFNDKQSRDAEIARILKAKRASLRAAEIKMHRKHAPRR